MVAWQNNYFSIQRHKHALHPSPAVHALRPPFGVALFYVDAKYLPYIATRSRTARDLWEPSNSCRHDSGTQAGRGIGIPWYGALWMSMECDAREADALRIYCYLSSSKSERRQTEAGFRHRNRAAIRSSQLPPLLTASTRRATFEITNQASICVWTQHGGISGLSNAAVRIRTSNNEGSDNCKR